jgi:hypothetical protein
MKLLVSLLRFLDHAHTPFHWGFGVDLSFQDGVGGDLRLG